MKQIRWFDRKFEFADKQNIFPSIVERLRGTPVRLRDKVEGISNEYFTVKLNGGWSIAENIGHLTDLEPLWQGRLDDILEGREELRPADLENRKTHLADHNSKEVDILVGEFSATRKVTVERLERLSEEEIYAAALHPRLKTPMRMMDLFLFVAEHDDHHLARMTELERELAV